MDQKLAEIFVAPLADPDQTRFAPGRELPRYQTEPGSQIASTRKALAPTDGCDQGRGIQYADSRNGHEAARRLFVARPPCKSLIEFRNAAIQLTPLRPHVRASAKGRSRSGSAVGGDYDRAKDGIALWLPSLLQILCRLC